MLADLLQLPVVDAAVAARYADARPFPHAIFDSVVSRDTLDAAIEAFPDDGWPHWSRMEDSYQPDKWYCQNLLHMPRPLADLITFTAQPVFLEWLERLTGIDHLLPDPHLVGGGLHRSGAGGTLRAHTDFHEHRTGLYRRVNALLYLNRDWNDDGGALALFDTEDPSRPVRTVRPEAGRLVVFTTDDNSVHGFPVPVPSGRVRRSIALYFYTADERRERFAGDSNTFWRTHRPSEGPIEKARMLAYRTLLLLSRATSYGAHRVHPEFGSITRRRR